MDAHVWCEVLCGVYSSGLYRWDGPVKEVKESVNTIFKSIDTQ